MKFDFSDKAKFEENVKEDFTESHVYLWTFFKFKDFGIKVDGVGNILHPTLTVKDVMDRLIILNSDVPKNERFSVGAIQSSLDQIVLEEKLRRLEDIRQHIHSTKITESKRQQIFRELVDLMDCAGDGCAFTAEECALLLRKFIWQVKRKLANLQVTNHLMVVLVGEQGGGKSEFVNALTTPVRDVSTNTNLADITSEKMIQLFDNYVGVIDELDKADRANVETLKRTITDTYVSRRPMRSNSSINIKQNMTLIGTSNRDIQEAIIDETGNRRFAQIDIIGRSHPSSKAFWRLVNAFDWVGLWRAVDETLPDPTAPIQQRINEVQAAQRNQSLIELWVESMQEAKNDILINKQWYPTDRLFIEYSQWEQEFAPRWSSSIKQFSNQMARLSRQRIIPFSHHRTNGKRGYNSL
jgi:energy-coupling factor transporter ATP-binding protein EcfA2